MQNAIYSMLKPKAVPVEADFKERLMLAVTQVNGCQMCSYAHAQKALKAGVADEEIRSLLEGDMGVVPPEQMRAVLFAQHYADSRGNPDPETLVRLRASYDSQAEAILAVIREIMAGNCFGIPLGSAKKRLGGTPDHACSLGYIAAMGFTAVVGLPFALLCALVRLPFPG